MTIEEIKQYMKANQMTQIELAARSGVPLQTLRGIFSGRTPHPRIDTMQAIERALGFDDNKQLTSEEIKAGATFIRKDYITPDEEDLLYIYRRLPQAAQRALIEVANSLAGTLGQGEQTNKKA